MHQRSADQIMTDCGSLRQDWENLRKHDPEAVAEHVFKLRVLATYLNARVVQPDTPQA